MCEILLCEIRVGEIPAREIQIVDQFESVSRCAWPYSGPGRIQDLKGRGFSRAVNVSTQSRL
jgi:hypothetical protein